MKWLALIGGGLGDKVWDKEIIVDAETFAEAYKQVIQQIEEYDCDIFILESDERVGTIKARIRQDTISPIVAVMEKYEKHTLEEYERGDGKYYYRVCEQLKQAITETIGKANNANCPTDSAGGG